MERSNEYIGDRIRQARKDRNRTQSELADALGKTTGAISQLEQGNVQVSVVELAKIADFLNKPIEYFFGEEYMGDDVQTLVAVIRKMPPDVRKEQVAWIQSLLEIQTIGDEFKNRDNLTNEEIETQARKTLATVRVQEALIKNIWDQLQEAKKSLETIIGQESSNLI
ncbi:MAG: helix-turn-helix domain-containing protein [Cyclobacteriaceae bacterium]